MRLKLLVAMLCAAATQWLAAEILTPAIQADFERQAAIPGLKPYMEIFSHDLTEEQRQALTVLYAYMPAADIVDNSGEFFLQNVDVSLQAREEMPWGRLVPDREFRHFVLPVRINDEALDNHRRLFYDELKPRIEGLSMQEAILEINHWCHEKATYQPSDGRTHSPLATVCSAIGRCGEESVFTVAALRAMCIPARQIYTPRWAHTDDNHAWVEAWADGKWHFLGACEPEAVLDLGWFNAPAARGMLMNARVFGNYDGPEECLLRQPGFTDINVTENYAPVDTLSVVVRDASGNPVAGASVNFCLYNYGEFYPIVSKRSDNAGRASLVTGLGDLLVWATDGSQFGFSKLSTGRSAEAPVVLGNPIPPGAMFDFDIVPPAEAAVAVEVAPQAADENNRRKAAEDAMRAAYASTFCSPGCARALASELQLDASRLEAVMADARGNHADIEAFLRTVSPQERGRALRLLEVMSQKDRSDVPLGVLTDHLASVSGDSALWEEYILNPRIDNELLTPWRGLLTAAFAADAPRFRENPAMWVRWVADSITLIPDWNPARVRMSPVGVFKSRVANEASRNIFFVAGCRAMGIPARIDAVTGKTQWASEDGTWNDVHFAACETAGEPMAEAPGFLMLDFTPVGRIDNPKYYTQFTISKIVDGEPRLLNYPDEATLADICAEPLPLDPGQYMLVTGQRMASGSVLSRVRFFDIQSGTTARVPLEVRQSADQLQVIGAFNSENLYHDTATGTDKSLLSTTGRGYYILGLLAPGNEPTNHALRDIAACRAEFEALPNKMVLLFRDSREAGRFDASLLPPMPSTAVWGTDIEGAVCAELLQELKLAPDLLPVFIIADTFNRVVFVSQGYTIGLGERLSDILYNIGGGLKTDDSH